MKKRKHLLAADSVIINNNHVVLVKRRFPPGKGCWVLPGGMVEPGETIKEALVREAKEETGLDVEPLRMIGIYDDPERDPRAYVVSVAYLCKLKGGKLHKSRECEEVRFFDINDALNMNLGFDHGKILRDGLMLLGFLGKKVLVGGTFNIIHPGHIYFLRKSKSFGKRLVVVVSNDETAKKKGKLIFPAKERKKLLESLRFVDKVIIGDKKDFFKVIEKERPDIIALGYDQEIDLSTLKKRTERLGIDVRIKRIDKYGDYSTRKIIKK
ncbi:MAG: hypothetical protein DRP15_00330 [Candidatus Aenigmatarchaeota archaeon]|nr:MAG: hypothetical protein DRP15_00330 [Candidatus Aenigmarchaeota archaeon]